MDQYNSRPNLVRTSSLDPHFIRSNLSLVNTPVKLLFEKDSKEITENWTKEEVEAQRRLVKFEFVRISASDYLVKFRPIPRSEFTNDAAIVSCIFWKEKELNIVTSVDIILLLEYLIQQSFSIEEKNRIRRNLQSLRPLTISRSNTNSSRFFQLLMSMEDPRPRNIEKDLKVFKWSDLFVALNKVISKYSSSTPMSESDRAQAKLQEQVPPQIGSRSSGRNSYSHRKILSQSSLSSHKSLSQNQPQVRAVYDDQDEVQSITTTTTSRDPNTNVTTTTTTITTIPDRSLHNHHNNHNHHSHHQDHSHGHNRSHNQHGDHFERESFLPFERLKVMKKKINNHGSGTSPKFNLAQYANSAIPDKHKVYQVGITPADPRPIGNQSVTSMPAEPQIQEIPNSRGRNPNYNDPLQHPQVKQFKQESAVQQAGTNGANGTDLKKNMDVDSETSSAEESGESGSTYGITSSDEQGEGGDDKKSRSRSAEADISSDMRPSKSVESGNQVPYNMAPYQGFKNDSKQSLLLGGSSSSGGLADESSNSRSTGQDNKSSIGMDRSSSGNNSGSMLNDMDNSRYSSGKAGSGSVFSKANKSHFASAYCTGASSVTNHAEKPAQQPSESFSNINKFAQDQSDRIFGIPPQENGKPFYQYPDASQIHYMPNNHLNSKLTHKRSSLKSGVPPQPSPHLLGTTATHTSQKLPFVAKKDTTSTKSDIQLPSLEEYFTGAKDKDNTKLPPIRAPSKSGSNLK